MKFQNLKGNLMSNKEDNIEDLEIELKELKKKKLQKEISRLEDELNNLDTNYQPKKNFKKANLSNDSNFGSSFFSNRKLFWIRNSLQ